MGGSTCEISFSLSEEEILKSNNNEKMIKSIEFDDQKWNIYSNSFVGMGQNDIFTEHQIDLIRRADELTGKSSTIYIDPCIPVNATIKSIIKTNNKYIQLKGK